MALILSGSAATQLRQSGIHFILSTYGDHFRRQWLQRSKEAELIASIKVS